MIELDNDALMLARGRFATVRGVHEDAKRDLMMLCSLLSSVSTKILRQMQPANDDIPVSVSMLVEEGRATLDKIEAMTKHIEALAIQRAALKVDAWPR